jgi:hypothetical protein
LVAVTVVPLWVVLISTTATLSSAADAACGTKRPGGHFPKPRRPQLLSDTVQRVQPDVNRLPQRLRPRAFDFLTGGTDRTRPRYTRNAAGNLTPPDARERVIETVDRFPLFTTYGGARPPTGSDDLQRLASDHREGGAARDDAIRQPGGWGNAYRKWAEAEHVPTQALDDRDTAVRFLRAHDAQYVS